MRILLQLNAAWSITLFILPSPWIGNGIVKILPSSLIIIPVKARPTYTDLLLVIPIKAEGQDISCKLEILPHSQGSSLGSSSRFRLHCAICILLNRVVLVSINGIHFGFCKLFPVFWGTVCASNFALVRALPKFEAWVSSTGITRIIWDLMSAASLSLSSIPELWI